MGGRVCGGGTGDGGRISPPDPPPLPPRLDYLDRQTPPPPLSILQDYQEEISVAQGNKQQLQAMGERLSRASQDSKAAEIQHKLSKVSERWQHLLDLIGAR